jgi:hypothetical protein
MHPTARRQVLALIRIQMRPWHVFRSKQSVGHRSLQEAISLRLPLNLCTTTLQTSHVSCHPVRLSVSIRISVRINLPAQTPQRQTHVATSHLVRLTVKVGKALCSPRRAHLGASASSTGFGSNPFASPLSSRLSSVTSMHPSYVRKNAALDQPYTNQPQMAKIATTHVLHTLSYMASSAHSSVNLYVLSVCLSVRHRVCGQIQVLRLHTCSTHLCYIYH